MWARVTRGPVKPFPSGVLGSNPRGGTKYGVEYSWRVKLSWKQSGVKAPWVRFLPTPPFNIMWHLQQYLIKRNRLEIYHIIFVSHNFGDIVQQEKEVYNQIYRDVAEVAYLFHRQMVAGSNPAPGTTIFTSPFFTEKRWQISVFWFSVLSYCSSDSALIWPVRQIG